MQKQRDRRETAIVPILIIRDRATAEQRAEMPREHGTLIKLAVDVERGIVAGGGEMHADCKAALLEDGGRQEDIWGASFYPATQAVGFETFINIRPNQGNRSMRIQDEALRGTVEKIAREGM